MASIVATAELDAVALISLLLILLKKRILNVDTVKSGVKHGHCILWLTITDSCQFIDRIKIRAKRLPQLFKDGWKDVSETIRYTLSPCKNAPVYLESLTVDANLSGIL